MGARAWTRVGAQFLPFADVASADLPLGRLLRLSMFQVSVGMAVVLLTGTLNRVMIVELDVPAWLVALMVSIPLVFAPFRALVGHRSDHHRSLLGWRRVPYIWFGSLLQFGGFAIMPFALLVLSGDTHGPVAIGQAGAALAFLLVGIGLHTTQTAGLALATDLAPAETRPRVVALMYVMLLLGMVASSCLFSWLLADFSKVRLIQVVQGAALATMALNILALWKQEARDPARTASGPVTPRLRQAWREFTAGGQARRLLVAVGLGSAAFSMQDVLLEPYGGEVLGLTVSSTTALTALLALGSLAGFALAARMLAGGADPYRLAGFAAAAGLFAFAAVVLAAPLDSPFAFRSGTVLIGFGGGLFAVSTMTAAMNLSRNNANGLALGAWGAVQASSVGVAIALGGATRDGIEALNGQGVLGSAFAGPAAAYGVVYHIEIALLFATIAAIGPLVRPAGERPSERSRFGLAEFPG